MRRILTASIISFLMTLITCAGLWAQATAQITGIVQDLSGAVLPGVEVTTIQTETGIARTAVTNETGSYVLPNLATGPYRLEAALAGFRSFVQTGIVLQVNSNSTVNITLQVGQVSEQVEVQANASLVETRSTAVGTVMENQRILDLPLQGRVVTDLIPLSGAAVQTRIEGGAGWNLGINASTFISVAGGLDFGVMYTLDGAMHNNGFDGAQMPMPFPDALQEFKVDVSGLGTNGSRGSGGGVSAVTKAGTNAIHGNMFEFVRNYEFNARDFFARQRDTLKRNQFGGTLGGPIAKNKLFFFGGFQETRTRSTGPGTALGAGTPTINFVPTAAMLAGDWTTFASPACNAGRQIALGAPFVNNRIDPSLYSKAALNISGRLPKPQDDCGRFNYYMPDNPNEFQGVGKVDYQQSAKHSIFARYMATTYARQHPYEVSPSNLLMLTASTGGYNNLAQSYALGSTYLIGANTINSFRLTLNRVKVNRPTTSYFSPADVGVNAYAYTDRTMIVAITGGFTFGPRNAAANLITNGYQLVDDVSLVRGNHQLTFGANLADWRLYERCLVGSEGTYAFTGQATGLGMADFLTGNLTTLTQATPPVSTITEWVPAFYIQDVWKTSPKLTLNAGLRWEPYLPQTIGYGIGQNLREGSMYHFSQEAFEKGAKSTVFPTGPAGLTFPGDPGFPNGGPNNKKWWKLAPRLGVAWDPKGDGRTSIRAAYGLAYDFSGVFTLAGSGVWTPPWGLQTIVTSPAGGFENPWQGVPGGNPFPYVRTHVTQFPLLSSYLWVQNFDSSPPTVQTWNLSVQRQLPGKSLLSVSYLGSQSYHLWVANSGTNRAVYFPGAPTNGICRVGNYAIQTTGPTCSTNANTNQRRRLFLLNPQEGQYFGNMVYREGSGTAGYNALLVSVQHRVGSGLNLVGNYTWSHCTAIDPTGASGGGIPVGYLNPNNRNFDQGNCSSDRRQFLNATAVAATPQFANRTLRMFGTGWQLSGIYRWSTGSYMTISAGLDRLLSGELNQRPDQVLGNPYGDRSSITRYLNPSAFAQPALGAIGNMGPLNIEGPGFWQLDTALSRNFQFRESQKLEFRAEAFNVTNSLRRANPTTALNSNLFGQITSDMGARVMQFALKYFF